MVDESKPVHVYVTEGLLQKVRLKLNVSPKMPATYVVDTALREYLEMPAKESEVRVLEQQPRQASP
jgi:hypothetical protein